TQGKPHAIWKFPHNHLVCEGVALPPKRSRMTDGQIRAFQDALELGMGQYGLAPIDLADHEHHPGARKSLQRLNAGPENDPIPCPACVNEPYLFRRRSAVAKMVENARLPVDSDRPRSAKWAYTLLCMLNQTKKTLKWRIGRDPGADEWRWHMHRAAM